MAKIEKEVLGCCGLWGVYNLSVDDEEETLEEAVDAVAEASQIEVENESDCDCDDCNNRGSGPGISIATTNEDQEDDGVGAQLRTKGFHAVLNTLNPNSGNRITLWVRDLTEKKVPQELAQSPTPASLAYSKLLTAVAKYVEKNPTPRSASGQALVKAFEEITTGPF